jgi:hypothetical protein
MATGNIFKISILNKENIYFLFLFHLSENKFFLNLCLDQDVIKMRKRRCRGAFSLSSSVRELLTFFTKSLKTYPGTDVKECLHNFLMGKISYSVRPWQAFPA